MKCTPLVSHNTAAVCLRSCSRTPFVAGITVPSSAVEAGRLAGWPIASRAGQVTSARFTVRLEVVLLRQPHRMDTPPYLDVGQTRVNDLHHPKHAHRDAAA